MANVQGGAALPAEAAAAAHSLPGIRSSSLQQPKDTRNLAVPQKQLAAEQPAYEAMAEDTAHSPVAEQQVTVSFVLPLVLLMHKCMQWVSSASSVGCWPAVNLFCKACSSVCISEHLRTCCLFSTGKMLLICANTHFAHRRLNT